jgi:hypothetical protein
MSLTVTGRALEMTSRAVEPGYRRDGPQSPRITPPNHWKNLRYHGRSNPQALIRRWMSAFLIRGFSMRAANGFGTREKMPKDTIITIKMSGIMPRIRRIM